MPVATIRIRQLVAPLAPAGRPTASTATLLDLDLYGAGTASPLTISPTTPRELVPYAMWESQIASPARKVRSTQAISLASNATLPMWPTPREHLADSARPISLTATIATRYSRMEPSLGLSAPIATHSTM